MKNYCFFTSTVSYHGFFITKEEKLFCFGWNRSGQLGLNDKNERIKPCESNFFHQKFSSQIISISCGLNHSVFVMSNGVVFSCGRKECGSFGWNCKDEHVTPDLIASLTDKNIVNVSSGFDFSIFLTDKGSAFGLGNNFNGTIGCGDHENKFSPAKVKIDEKILEVQCGYQFSVFLTKTKKLYITGGNSEGCLGLGHRTKINFPVLIPFFENKIIKKFSVGYSHSIVVDSENNVFGFGSNFHRKLGGNSARYSNPSRILGLKDKEIQNVLCGGNCTFFVCTGKEYFGLGDNNQGCLGTGKIESSKTMIKLNYFQKRMITSVYSSSCSTYFITENQEIYGCVEVLLSNSFTVKEKVVSHHFFVTKLNFSRNLKLLEKDMINIVFPNKQNNFIYCSTALRSSYLKDIILKNQFSLELADKYYESVNFIKDWMNGKVPVIKTLEHYKLTYFLSQKWFILDLNYYLVKNLDKLFELESIIDLIFELEEENKNNDSLFLQCQIILKKNHSHIHSNLLSYLEQKKSIESSSQILTSLVKVKGGILFQQFPTLESLEEYSKVKRELSVEELFVEHQNYLLNDETTKNIAFITLDDRIIKVHKEIIIRHKYYRVMLTNPIWEESKKTVIKVNLRSKYLIPFIIFIYTKQVNYSNLSKEDLITFSFYCGKFVFPEIKTGVDKEIEQYQKENTSILDNQIKLYQKNSELEVEKDDLKFQMENKFEKKETEIKSVRNEFEELKTENKSRISRINNLEGKFVDLTNDFENIKKSLNPSRKRKREDDETDEENQKKKKKL